MRVVTIMLLLALTCVGGAHRGFADEIKRPVVFVPGILGSRLCDLQERIIWGARSSFGNLSQLELDVPTNPVLHPCGLVDEIQILGSLWTHNTYKSWIAGLADIGFAPEKKNLFLFAYDWRLSNYENAKRLDAFVAENIGSGRPFDIVAHSMGGIVSRIYLNEYASAKSVQQIIYLGTPFLGSMNAFGTIKEGWGWPFDAMAGGQDVVARVSLSFPGMLELLPRYDDCCYIRKSDNSRKPLDIFDPQTWRSLGWLPAAYTAPQRFERFSDALKRSSGLTSLLTQPAPPGVYEIIFASDLHDTLRLLGMKEGATTPSDWVFTSSKGDGTVPVWSVARRMKSDGYSNTLPSFAKHEHLFDDKWVDSTIFRNLVAARPDASFKISSPGRPTLSVTVNGAPQFWPVRLATLALNKKAYKPGELATAELTIELEDTASDLVPGIYGPTATIEQSGPSQPIEVRELTNSDDLAAKQLRFAVSAQVRTDEGIGLFAFHIEDALDSSQAFYVSPATN